MESQWLLIRINYANAEALMSSLKRALPFINHGLKVEVQVLEDVLF